MKSRVILYYLKHFQGAFGDKLNLIRFLMDCNPEMNLARVKPLTDLLMNGAEVPFEVPRSAVPFFEEGIQAFKITYVKETE